MPSLQINPKTLCLKRSVPGHRRNSTSYLILHMTSQSGGQNWSRPESLGSINISVELINTKTGPNAAESRRVNPCQNSFYERSRKSRWTAFGAVKTNGRGERI